MTISYNADLLQWNGTGSEDNAITMKRRFGGHHDDAGESSPTEWEIYVESDDDAASAIKDLPRDFKRVLHSGNTGKHWARQWLFLPVDTTQKEALHILALIEGKEPRRLLYALKALEVAITKED